MHTPIFPWSFDASKPSLMLAKQDTSSATRFNYVRMHAFGHIVVVCVEHVCDCMYLWVQEGSRRGLGWPGVRVRAGASKGVV